MGAGVGAVAMDAGAEAEEGGSLTGEKKVPTKVAWGYAPENGPAAWGGMRDEWALCDAGTAQSPIALSYRSAVVSDVAKKPRVTTGKGSFKVKWKEVLPFAACKSLVLEPYVPPPPPLVGDAPPVDIYSPPPPAAVLSIPDVGEYRLRNVHFHADRSEHVLNGNAGVMEAHFVFDRLSRTVAPEDAPDELSEAADANIAVVGLMASSAEKSSPWFSSFMAAATAKAAEDIPQAGFLMDIDLTDVIPDFDSTDVYTYAGSLTTPPGTEGIRWIVIGEQAKASKADIAALVKIQQGPNSRPVQPLGSRKVARFPATTG